MITNADILAALEPVWVRGKPERARFLKQNRAAALDRLRGAMEILREQEAFTAEASPLVDLRDKLERRLVEAAAAGARLDGGMLRDEIWSLREPLGDFVAAPRRIDDARKVLKMAGMLAVAGPCLPHIEPMALPSEPPLERAPVRVNRKALRAALSTRPELVEALEAAARGAAVEEASYSADVGVMWKLAMDSLYKSSDLPALGTREALQNSVDAIRAAIKAKQVDKGAGYFRVIWDPARRALSWEDNGLGMDAETVIGKFLSLGSSGKRDAVDSDEAAGGFGIAKAVILGTSSTFRWEMHTRDNIFVSDGFSSKVKRYKAEYRQGTSLTVYDVAQEYDRQYDYAQGTYLSIVERLRRLLGASDLPDITLSVNGSEVSMMFPRRSGTKVPVAGNWGTDTEVSIKAYRRAEGDRQGAYYVRLGGLFQFPISGHNLKRDFVLDFTTKARPGSRQYPFNAARDSFAGLTSDAFDDFRQEVEIDTESAGRDLEDEIYDPESDDADSRSGANELGELAAEAFADPELQRAMAQAAGGIVDYYAERQRGKNVRGDDEQTSFAPAGSRARPKDDDEERDSEPAAIPPGFKTPGSQLHATMIDDPKNAALELRMVLAEASNADEAGVPSSNIITPTVDTVLRAAEAGQELTTRDVAILTDAIDRATENSMAPGGGGLIQAAAVDQAADKALRGMLRDVPALRPAKRNPFGKLAGLRINKKNYDRQKAYRFKKNFKKWIPPLTLWDAVLRLVANEAGIRRRFKPGFVLNDTVNGLASDSVIYINPDKMAAAIRAHKLRPIAAAGYIHAKAVHELTHFKGFPEHNENFVSHREDLSAATFHLLPAIALLTQKILQLPETPDQKSVAKLEKQLERVKRGKGKRSDEEYAALRKQLAELRSDLAEAARESVRLQDELEAGAEKRRVTPAELLDAWVGAKAIYDNARRRILDGAGEPEIARLHSALRRAAAHVGGMALACEERQEQLAVPGQSQPPSRCRDDVRELNDGKGPILVRTRCNYDPAAAAEFKRNIAAWRPHRDAWQRVLEITAQAGGIDRKFRCGLLLCTQNKAFATETDDGGDPILYLQPELLQDVIELDPDPHAVAGYLKPAADHELAHLPLMGKGHNDDFIAAREDLAQRTGKVMPKIVEVAEALLRRTGGMQRRREEALKRTAGRLPVARAVAMVRSAAGPGCLRPDWRKRRPKDACSVWGCCYVAAEAVYHLAGGAESGLRPMFVRHENAPHWYLVDAHGHVVDPTAEQFVTPPDYSKGIGKGFLTVEPSARATALMQAALAGERVEGCPMSKAVREEACPCSRRDRAEALPARQSVNEPTRLEFNDVVLAAFAERGFPDTALALIERYYAAVWPGARFVPSIHRRLDNAIDELQAQGRLDVHPRSRSAEAKNKRRAKALRAQVDTAIRGPGEALTLAAEGLPKWRRTEALPGSWSLERMVEWMENKGRKAAADTLPAGVSDDDDEWPAWELALRALDDAPFYDQVEADINDTGGALQDRLIQAFAAAYDPDTARTRMFARAEAMPYRKEDSRKEIPASLLELSPTGSKFRRVYFRSTHRVVGPLEMLVGPGIQSISVWTKERGQDRKFVEPLTWDGLVAALRRASPVPADTAKQVRWAPDLAYVPELEGAFVDADRMLADAIGYGEPLRRRGASIHEAGFEIDAPHDADLNHWSLTFNPVEACPLNPAPLFAAYNRPGNAYDWELIFQRALFEVDPTAYRAITWDSEASQLWALADTPEPLRALARAMRSALSGREVLRQAIAELPRQPARRRGCETTDADVQGVLEHEVRMGRTS